MDENKLDKETENTSKANGKGVVSSSGLDCPVCKREWPQDCEQGRAIVLRNKCIVCIAESDENIKIDPYEFRAI